MNFQRFILVLLGFAAGWFRVLLLCLLSFEFIEKNCVGRLIDDVDLRFFYAD